ncbi:MAG TPA: hypothetical protein VIT01_22985 [Acidimicrobiales bacterium]
MAKLSYMANVSPDGFIEDARGSFELVDERRFANGVVYLRYRDPPEQSTTERGSWDEARTVIGGSRRPRDG